MLATIRPAVSHLPPPPTKRYEEVDGVRKEKERLTTDRPSVGRQLPAFPLLDFLNSPLTAASLSPTPFPTLDYIGDIIMKMDSRTSCWSSFPLFYKLLNEEIYPLVIKRPARNLFSFKDNLLTP
jgi:hypothetical protein